VHLGERLRFAINREPVRLCDRFLSITLSLGVTVSDPGCAAAPEALLRAADQALYRAKDLGRNRVEWMTPTPGVIEPAEPVEVPA
jgi:diguanylate cyclase (GGDEF)-like protein